MKNRLLNLTSLKIVVLTLALFSASSIAALTKRGAHPDEPMHLNAFQYFNGKLWPPDLGSDEVKYSPYGVSRVYSGEIIYIFYGNLAFLIRTITDSKTSYITFRFFNVLLFIITLYVLLFSTSKKNIFIPAIGFVFACIPQVYYVYAYANSDAWAISLSIFIFLFTLNKCSISLFEWKIKDIFLLGVLTGLTLLTKKNFYISLILPYSLIIYYTIKSRRTREQHVTALILFRTFFFWFFPLLMIITPLKLFYPLTQGNYGDYKKLRRAVAEKKAPEGLKPHSHPGRKLNQKGHTYFTLLAGTPWIKCSAKSFWGMYGNFAVWNRQWIYNIVFFIAFVLIVTTLFNLMIHKPDTDFLFLIFISILVITINLIASLRYSLYTDFQPQGRYLFPSLISLSILLIGDFYQANKAFKMSRMISFLTFYPLCIYSLLYVCLLKLS